MLLERDLSKYGEFISLYKDLITKSETLFKSKIDELTVFHSMMIDRVVDAYLDLLLVKKDAVRQEEKMKMIHERLQKWLAMAFGELHSASNEAVSRKLFYQNFVTVIRELISDSMLRQKIFENIGEIMKRGKINVENGA